MHIFNNDGKDAPNSDGGQEVTNTMDDPVKPLLRWLPNERTRKSERDLHVVQRLQTSFCSRKCNRQKDCLVSARESGVLLSCRLASRWSRWNRTEKSLAVHIFPLCSSQAICFQHFSLDFFWYSIKSSLWFLGSIYLIKRKESVTVLPVLKITSLPSICCSTNWLAFNQTKSAS